MKYLIKSTKPDVTLEQVLQYFAKCAERERRVTENRKRFLNETIKAALKGRNVVIEIEKPGQANENSQEHQLSGNGH